MITWFDICWFVPMIISILIGLKIVCKMLDDGYKMQQDTDKIWDQNGWSRPNRKKSK